MKGFLEFIRKQGVVGFAVGFILGSAISKVANAVINDIINPFIGIFLGATGDLQNAYFQIGSAKFMWGDLVNNLLNFILLAFVIYFGVKVTRLDRLDKEK